MKTPLSASDIEVLLHYYVNTCEHLRYDTLAVKQAVDMFIGCGMLEPSEGPALWQITEKGSAMVRALCRTPEPQLIYADANRNPL
jgi:hypothetical protein